MLLVIQSIIVYGLIIWVMTYWGQVAYKSQYPKGFGIIDRLTNKSVSPWEIFSKPYFIIPIFIFCLFASVRYKVGVDCESYKEIFYDIGKYGESRRESIEPAYVFLSKLVYGLTGHHYLMMYILAFLQIGTYYIALRKDRYALVFLGLVLFLTGEYWSWMNGIRQNIAACAFVAIIPLITQKKYVSTMCVIFMAMSVHQSALILLPLSLLAFFLRKNILNKYIQIGILFVSLIMMNKFNGILSNISYLAEHAGYGERSITAYTELEETSRTFGFRMILLYIVHSIVIWFSPNLSSYINKQTFNIWYNLYFIGICLTVLFYNNFTIMRILYYCIIFTPVIISTLLYYLYNKKEYQIFFYIIAFLLLTRTLYNFYTVTADLMNESILYKFDL